MTSSLPKAAITAGAPEEFRLAGPQKFVPIGLPPTPLITSWTPLRESSLAFEEMSITSRPEASTVTVCRAKVTPCA